MRIVTFILSSILILWSLFIVAFKHQHAGLYTETERRDFILWAIYSFILFFCVVEILLSWINRRGVSNRLMLILYLLSSIALVVFVWQLLDGYDLLTMLFQPQTLPVLLFFDLPLAISQALLVYIWCIKPFKGKSLKTSPPQIGS